MALIRWTPLLEPFEEMEKAFGDLMPQVRHGFTPALDVYDNTDAIVVETPLPGVDPTRVDIVIENGVLTIKGNMEKKREIDEENYWRREVRLGSFYRSVALPTPVRGDRAEATYEKGILKISIPKAEEAKAKKIAVKIK